MAATIARTLDVRKTTRLIGPLASGESQGYPHGGGPRTPCRLGRHLDSFLVRLDELLCDFSRSLEDRFMFIRVVRPSERKEILVSVDHIWKIEVSYGIPETPDEANTTYYKTSVDAGSNDPNAIRWYDVFVGSEVIKVIANPDDPVMQVIEKIYREAVKG